MNVYHYFIYTFVYIVQRSILCNDLHRQLVSTYCIYHTPVHTQIKPKHHVVRAFSPNKVVISLIDHVLSLFKCALLHIALPACSLSVYYLCSYVQSAIRCVFSVSRSGVVVANMTQNPFC